MTSNKKKVWFDHKDARIEGKRKMRILSQNEF